VTYRHAEARPEILITDPHKIAGLLDFVAKRNRDWRKPGHTFPVGEYTVSLERNNATVLVLWISPGWMGGREGGRGASDNRLRSLTSEDWTKLVELLEINSRHAEWIEPTK
jgi:hypothetical protein